MSQNYHPRVEAVSHDTDALPGRLTRTNSSNMGSQEAIIQSTPPSATSQEIEGDQGGASADVELSTTTTYKLSKQRWLVLFAIALFGLVSAGTGEFNAILSVMLDLLELPLDEYIYIGQLFMYFPLITSLPIAWSIDKYGLKLVMYVAAFFMLIRGVFRALMFYPDFPNWERFKLTYWILSSLASSQSVVIFFCIPLKVSENWFAESERSVAWTVMISSYAIGVTLASLAYPHFIQQVSDVKPLAYLNFASAIIVPIVVALCITRSKPKYPPSERTFKSSAKDIPWLPSIKRMFSHRDIVLHMLHGAIYDGMTMAIVAVIQDILTNSGHRKKFTGYLISIDSLLTVAVMVGLSAFVHRVTNVVATCKLASVIRTLVFIVHLLTLLYPTDERIIVAVSAIFVVCRSWASPNYNNMTAYLISGTVSEATMAGVTSAIYVISISLNQVLFVKLIDKNDSDNKSDYTYSMAMSSILCVINTLVYVIFFGGQSVKQDNDSPPTRRDSDSNQQHADSADPNGLPPDRPARGAHDNQTLNMETEHSNYR